MIFVGGVSDADEARKLRHAIGLGEASYSPITAQSSIEPLSCHRCRHPFTSYINQRKTRSARSNLLPVLPPKHLFPGKPLSFVKV